MNSNDIYLLTKAIASVDRMRWGPDKATWDTMIERLNKRSRP